MGGFGYSREYYEQAEERRQRRLQEESTTTPSSVSKDSARITTKPEPEIPRSQIPNRYNRRWVI